MILSDKALLFDLKNVSPWDDVNKEPNAVQKFLLYRSHNKDSVVFDCDSSNGSSRFANALYSALWDWDFEKRMNVPDRIKNLVSVSWDRYGPDTINSFMTTYNAAIKIYGSDVVAQKNTLLQEFASLTHCLSNFTLVPFKLNNEDEKSFNQYRGANFGKYFVYDYFDLSLKVIKEVVTADSFKQYVDTFVLNDYVDDQYCIKPLMSKHRHFLMSDAIDLSHPSEFLPKTEAELNEYLSNVVSLIKARSKRLATAISKIQDESKGLCELDILAQAPTQVPPTFAHQWGTKLKVLASKGLSHLWLLVKSFAKASVKTFLWFLIKYSILAMLIYFTLPLYDNIEFIKRPIQYDMNGNIDLSEFLGYTLSMYILLALGMLYIRYKFKDQLRICKKCKRYFAVKEVNRELISTRDISVLVKSHDRNRSGEITATREQYVPGLEEKYKTKEVCRYCKNEATYTLTNKRPLL